MKNLTLMLIGCVVASSCFSQKIYRKAQWGINETKESGTQITRLEGENRVIVVTNIGYQSQQQLIDELKQKKSEGKIGGDIYKKQLAEFKEHSVGGQLYLYIEREDVVDCEMENFDVILRDVEGNEIQRKSMRSQAPEMKRDGSGYKNDGTVFVKTPIEGAFIVEIIEKKSTGEVVYKFKVG